MNLLSSIKSLCIDFLFPKNEKVLRLEAHTCATLLDTLPRAPEPEDKYTIVLFDYKYPTTREIIWELKYNGNTSIANKLGEILYDAIRHELSVLAPFESDPRQKNKLLLIPVPISNKRRFERGWNQTELLCKRIMALGDTKIFTYVPNQLVKIRHTESQVKLGSKDARRENLVNSMKVLDPRYISGKFVVLVDDVMTTGSTFREARRALREAGAKKILCVAIAH